MWFHLYRVTKSAKCIQEKDGGFEGPGDVTIQQPVLDEDRASIWEHDGGDVCTIRSLMPLNCMLRMSKMMFVLCSITIITIEM